MLKQVVKVLYSYLLLAVPPRISLAEQIAGGVAWWMGDWLMDLYCFMHCSASRKQYDVEIKNWNLEFFLTFSGSKTLPRLQEGVGLLGHLRGDWDHGGSGPICQGSESLFVQGVPWCGIQTQGSTQPLPTRHPWTSSGSAQDTCSNPGTAFALTSIIRLIKIRLKIALSCSDWQC